jgi:hypothetical protein
MSIAQMSSLIPARRRYRIVADTTLGVVATTVTVGRNVREQGMPFDKARRAVAVAHKLSESEVTEVIEVWLENPDESPGSHG